MKINNKFNLIIIMMVIFIYLSTFVTADFGQRHFNPYPSGQMSTYFCNDVLSQEYNMAKDGTVAYWCPSISANGNRDLTFWISEIREGSIYQNSNVTHTSQSDSYWTNGCIDMPNVTVTKNQTLYFNVEMTCQGGDSGWYYVYGGVGYPSEDSIVFDTINYYPRYQNKVSDGRWYKNSVPINATPVYSGYLYDDGTGNAFPDSQSVPDRVIGSKKSQNFYVPYNELDITNYSMIFSGATNNEYWEIELSNSTTVISECGSNQTFSAMNLTGYRLWTCDLNSSLTLTKGNYSIGVKCWNDASNTVPCNNAPTYIKLYKSDIVGAGRFVGFTDPLAPVDGYDSPLHSNFDDYYFLLITGTVQDITECSDGFDNDNDSYIDYPNDPECSSLSDSSESIVEVIDENCTTSCSSWTDPYYLYEEFNGSIDLCGWATLENVCFEDEFERELTDSYYSAFKETDTLTEENSRYATVSFDLKPISVNTNGYIAFSVYDEDYTRYIQFFLSDDTNFYNNEGGSSELVYSNVTNNTYKTVQLHIDFTNNDFDLWYDGNKVAESLGLSNNFFDAINVGGIRISSSSINYNIDNVAVYSSDQNNELLPSDTVIVAPVDDSVSMCGLFLKSDIDCSVDSDCVTDDCKPNGKCNHFDMTYCDENGYARGNKCFINAVTYCTLDSTQEIILNNFLLFLVFIIIIIGIIYVIFLLKS